MIDHDKIQGKINIVSVSGGVDSTACYLLALESGEPFRAVFADTGNEHEVTLEYIRSLPRLTGGPEVQEVRADFRQRISVRRAKLEMMRDAGEYTDGWDAEKVSRVLEHLHPTGIPMLDLCLWKGRFPSSMARFCTIELKLDAIKRYCTGPAVAESIARGGRPSDVIQWVGIRRDESRARAGAEEWSTDSLGNLVYRPLVEWTKQACFDLLKRHEVKPNPLYKLGMGRVGCMPCINARKAEILAIAQRFPEHIEKIREWEQLISTCSKKGKSTFFPCNAVPGTGDDRAHIDAVVEWSKTGRGGAQYSMDALMDPPACSSLYGLCE